MRLFGLLVVAAVSVSACSAAEELETVGRTGVSSAEGDLVIVWGSCGEAEIGAVAMWQESKEGTDGSEDLLVGEWETGQRNREEGLLVPGALENPPRLDSGRAYVAQAMPTHGSEELAAVQFSLDEVAELGIGEVLIGTEEDSVVGTLEDLTDC